MSEWDEVEKSRMPLTDHLDDLRNGLIRSLIVLLVGSSLTYYYSDKLVFFLEQPILRVLPKDHAHLYFTGITDKFFAYLQVTLIAAAFLVSPYLFYEIWRFVSPALYEREKKFAIPFVSFASVAFLIGISFGFFVVIPYGYEFLVNFGNASDLPLITLDQYFSLTLKLLLAMGLIFELPVIMLLLAKIGIVNASFLAKSRGYAFVLSAVIAAVVTPTPDAFTMGLVMVPLYLLYEVSIFAVKWFVR